MMFEWKGEQLVTYPEIAHAVAAITTTKEAQEFVVTYNNSLDVRYGPQADRNIAYASTYLPLKARDRVWMLFGIKIMPTIYVPLARRGDERSG